MKNIAKILLIYIVAGIVTLALIFSTSIRISDDINWG